MTAPYLERARAFQCEREKSELSEVTPVEAGLSSLNSLNSHSQFHAVKFAMLVGSSDSTAEAWRSAIRAGIVYAESGVIAADCVQEDIDVWRELSVGHAWPPAPADLIDGDRERK